MPAGRPTKFTPARLAKLDEAFALGCTDIEACLFADVSVDALYDYQKRNPKYVQRKAALKETPVLLARTTVVKAMQDDAKLAMDYLARKKKDEFSLRSELTGKDGEQLLPMPILGGASANRDGDGA